MHGTNDARYRRDRDARASEPPGGGGQDDRRSRLGAAAIALAASPAPSPRFLDGEGDVGDRRSRGQGRCLRRARCDVSAAIDVNPWSTLRHLEPVSRGRARVRRAHRCRAGARVRVLAHGDGVPADRDAPAIFAVLSSHEAMRTSALLALPHVRTPARTRLLGDLRHRCRRGGAARQPRPRRPHRRPHALVRRRCDLDARPRLPQVRCVRVLDPFAPG